MPSGISNADATQTATRVNPPALRRRILSGLVGVGVGIVIFVAIFLYFYLKAPKTVIRPLNMQIEKLTENGGAQSAATSPDGRFAAFVKRGQQQSLWVKQIATGSEAQVVPPGAGYFFGQPTFSPDGNYIFYDHTAPQNDNEALLYSVPSLGGTAQRVLEDITTPISFSPDGKQMVFGHHDAGEKNGQLVIADSDGGNRRIIVERPDIAVNGAAPSWSADGKLIAVSEYDLMKGNLGSVLVFTPAGALVKSFALPALVDGVAWLPDSSGLFLQCRSQESNFRSQVKFQPYPSGELQNVTNDLNEYRDVTVTADGKALVTVQQQQSSGVYLGVVPAKWPSELQFSASAVTMGQADGGWLQWSNDGKLLFDDNDFHSIKMNPDGSGRTQIPDRQTNSAYAVSCGLDAIIVAQIRDNNLNLFRYNTLMRDSKQITFERDAEQPTCTNDGKFVYYNDNLAGPSLMRVSTEGGKPEVVAANAVNGVGFSPDEKRIAFLQFSGTAGGHNAQIVVQDVGGGNKSYMSAMGVVRGPKWAPDGRALILDKLTGQGTNLFYQPLDGSPATQITHFTSEPLYIEAFAFSPDGKQLAITRARDNNSDVVMFRNFR